MLCGTLNVFLMMLELIALVWSDIIYKDKYLESKVLLTLNNCGPTKCKRECTRFSGCDAINYVKDQLYCELLMVLDSAVGVFEKEGYSYSELSSWSLVSQKSLYILIIKKIGEFLYKGWNVMRMRQR